MLDPELSGRLDEISLKADQAYRSAEKVRKYILWTGVISAALFILPLIGFIFVIPTFINNYVNPINSMTGTHTASSSDIYNILGL